MARFAVQAILFDVDGTLLHTADIYYDIMRQACADLGVTAPGREIVDDVMIHGRQVVDIIFPPDLPERNAWIGRFRAQAALAWAELFPQRVRLVDGIRATLAQLLGRGFRLGIVTAAEQRVLQGLALAGVDGWFETVVSREHVVLQKPHPAPLLLAAAQMGVHPSQVAYVGDTPQDIKAARAAGMLAVAVRSGAGSDPMLAEQAPDLLLNSAAHISQHLDVASVTQPPAVVAISGRVATGLGEGEGFVALPWVQEQVAAVCGFRPHPGTLNVAVVFPAPSAARAALALCAGGELVPPVADFCTSQCLRGYLVSANAPPLPAGLVLPHVPGYPEDKLELVTAVHVKYHLGVRDGDTVTVVLERQGTGAAGALAAAAGFTAALG